MLSRIVLSVLFVVSLPALAQEEAEEPKKKNKDFPLSIEGRVDVGVEVERFKSGETVYETQLDIKTKRKNGVRAAVELEATSKDRLIRTDKVYIDIKHSEISKSKIGLMTRDFGLEYEKNYSERTTIRRTLVYKKLESMGLVGREFGYFWKRESEETKGGPAAGIFYTEAGNGNLQLSYITGRDQDVNFGSWTLLAIDKVDAGRQFVWSQAFALWKERGGFRYESELIGGVDPDESEFEKSFGDGKPVYFYALKQSFDYRFELDEEQSIRPLVVLSGIVHDADTPRYTSLSLLLGVHYEPFHHLMIGADVDLVSTNSKLDLDKRSYDQSEVKAVVRYEF